MTFLSFKNDVNVPSKRNKNGTKIFFVARRSMTKEQNLERDPLVKGRYGSENSDPHPDPYQNVTDPEH